MTMTGTTLVTFFLGLLATGAIVLLLFTAVDHWRTYKTNRIQAIARINAMLPQTQCGYCGYAGCRPYAKAILGGEAINKCPPGGAATIARLASLLDQPVQTLDPAHGEFRELTVARIREAECIGCTKCIQACPVDAILGAAKLMHTVIAVECSGCDLCVDPCPVDCIDMEPVSRFPNPAWPNRELPA